jgi:hypothetical protein
VRSDAFERFLRALNGTNLDRWQGEDFEGALRSLDGKERRKAESLLIGSIESDTIFASYCLAILASVKAVPKLRAMLPQSVDRERVYIGVGSMADRPV